MANAFKVGESVRIREVKGSPRPPAQWLGKRGRIVGEIAEREAPPVTGQDTKRATNRTLPERQYFVQMEGPLARQSVPESWLARV